MNAIAEILDKHCRTVEGNMTGERDVLPALERQLASVRGHTTLLFPIEQGEKRSCLVEEERLNKEIRRLRLRQFIFERQCPVLAPEALKLRNDKGLPLMALFSLDRADSTLTYSSSIGRFDSTCSSLPQDYLDVYDDIAGKMAATAAEIVRTQKRSAWLWFICGVALALAVKLLPQSAHPGFSAGIILSAIFVVLGGLFLNTVCRIIDGVTLSHSVAWSGLIPPPARRRIKEIQNLGASVVLLAEVKEWGTGIKRDPLILVADSNQFYIVDSFETTTLERHVALEYSHL